MLDGDIRRTRPPEHQVSSEAAANKLRSVRVIKEIAFANLVNGEVSPTPESHAQYATAALNHAFEELNIKSRPDGLEIFKSAYTSGLDYAALTAAKEAFENAGADFQSAIDLATLLGPAPIDEQIREIMITSATAPFAAEIENSREKKGAAELKIAESRPVYQKPEYLSKRIQSTEGVIAAIRNIPKK